MSLELDFDRDLLKNFFILMSNNIRLLNLSILLILFHPLSTHAAENINFTYKSIPISVSTQDLEFFAKKEPVSEKFTFYLEQLSQKQKDKLFNFLNSNYKLNSSAVNLILREPMGAKVVQSFGSIIQTPSGQNGEKNLKIALMKSAETPTGFSPLMVIKNFPTDIQLDSDIIQSIISQRSEVNKKTKILVKNLENLTEKLANTEPPSNIDLLPKLSQIGTFQVNQRTLTLQDRSRNRNFLADIYFPTGVGISKAPVIVIENGIGGKRDRLQYVAKYLTSHGFAVAISDHPGSDYQQQQKFIKGLSKEIFNPKEFIDRPLDISFLLNEIERINQSEFKGILQTQRVGVLGLSLGATTSLALAGSSINFSKLEQDCGSHMSLVNLSLFFQCRALEIPRKSYELRDKRIQAIFVLFPFSNSIYGKEGMNRIEIPTLWQALAEDNVTPILLEQLPSFQAINSKKKYLGILSGFPHIDLNFLQRTLTEQNQPNKARESDQLQAALSRFSLAFFKVYIDNNSSYLPYLKPAYIKTISKKSKYGVSFVESLPDEYINSDSAIRTK
jgi:predicted dienelactone hydrolase